MVLSRYYRFCPCGCGKSVRYQRQRNKYNKWGFYRCIRCERVWPDAASFYKSQERAGLRSVVPSRFKKTYGGVLNYG